MSDHSTTITRRNSGYTAIPNHVPRDTGLSLEARGFLCLIMTMADGWKFRRANLMKTCGVGKEKYHRITRELKDAGYLTIENAQGKDGRITGTNWIIEDSPVTSGPVSGTLDTGVPETRTPVNPPVGQTGTHKKEQLSKEEQEERYVFEFDQFLEISPSKEGRVKAFAAFKKAREKVSFETLIDSMQEYREACERKKTPDDFLIHPANWLANERWTDKPDQPCAKSPAAKSGARSEIDLEFYADWLNGNRPLYSNSISADLATQLFESGKVTAEVLRARLP